jgi:hypothetical protein
MDGVLYAAMSLINSLLEFAVEGVEVINVFSAKIRQQQSGDKSATR